MDLYWKESYCLIPDMAPMHLVGSARALVSLGQAPPRQWQAELVKVRPSRR